MNFQDLIIFLMSMVIMSWTWMETGLLITVKKMTKVDSTYPVKITPELSDRVWGFDPTSLKNTLFSIPGILDLNNSDIEPNAINVKRYPGVVGDGINDDTVGLQLALDEAAGRWVHFPPGDYFITDPLVLPENTRIKAYGARIFNHESHFYLIEVNSNCIIKGMELEGAGSTPYNEEGRGISIVGTVNNYKTNIKIEDCYIHDIGFISIWNHFTKNVTVRNTRMINQGYGGYMGLSVTDVLIDKCHVKGIYYTIGGASYGVAFTRGSGSSLVDNPRSLNCTVQNCLVEDNIYWKGLDTHCGDSINFLNNYVKNCFTAIEITRGNTPFAPHNCKISGNYVIGIATGGAGINVTGVVDGELARNNIVSGNIISRAGIIGNSSTAGIRCANTENTLVLGNVIEECQSNGVIFHIVNKNFVCEANIIRDVYSNSLTPNGIFIDGLNNTGVIGSNSFIRRDLSLGTFVGVRIIRINSSLIDDSVKITINPQNNDGWTNETIETGNFIYRTLINKIPIPLGREYQLWTESVGPSGGNNTRTWFEVPTGGSAYFGTRSGSPSHFMRFAATTLRYEATDNLFFGKLTVDPIAGELIVSKVKTSISGTGGSGNSLPIGISHGSISGIENYPFSAGTVFTVKNSNDRTFEIGADTVSNLWIRSLHGSDNNTWKRLKSVEGVAQTITTAGTINNLAIGATTDHLILTAATGLTGIISGLEGRELIIENRNTVSIAFTADSGSSDSANRTAFTYTLLAGEMLKVKYANTKWRRVN
jgi:hypothetical protein